MNQDFLFLPINKALNIKKETAEHLARLDIYLVKDLLFHIPFSFTKKQINPNLSFAKDGDKIVVDVTVEQIDISQSTSAKRPTKIICGNKTGTVTLNYFHQIPPFIFHRLRVGNQIRVSGTVHKYNYTVNINHPELITSAETSEIEPIYNLTYGITNSQIANYVKKLLDQLKMIDIPEWIPQEILNKEGFPAFTVAITNAHNPSQNFALNEASKRRLKYDELFANQIALKIFREETKSMKVHRYTKATKLQDDVLSSLNFTLTEAQSRVISEIESDQSSDLCMMRLLQGDVGSGKTLVALMTMLNAANANLQSALMAPTDLLASQHYIFFKKALENTNFKTALLTGKTKQSERNLILQDLAEGKIDILIGTHAIFQDKVDFANLSYVIIDEQHRFGVNQRIKLVQKGKDADVLIMTATPIPRSLCLTLFGDMDTSKLDSKPKNRLPIQTSVMHISKLEQVIFPISNKIQNLNEKIYWVCPLVKNEDVENNLLKLMDATSRYEYLRKIFGDKVGLVHGKMNSAQKEEIMLKFKSGKISILVATTVIEVGIDVPEATLIIIENSENFGLASLHQLRGRVGRGSKSSNCILFYDYKLTDIAKERLKIMKESEDGFEISEKDLELRGGGEVLGTKQSGEQDFKFANLFEDRQLLLFAHTEASKLFSREIAIDNNKKFLIKIFNYHNLNQILG